MANALRTLLARKTSANALVPECHVEVWTVCPLSSVGGERCLQLIARSGLPISYDLQARVVPNSSMYQEAVSQKGFSRLAPAFDGGVRQDLPVVSRSAMC